MSALSIQDETLDDLRNALVESFGPGVSSVSINIPAGGIITATVMYVDFIKIRGEDEKTLRRVFELDGVFLENLIRGHWTPRDETH